MTTTTQQKLSLFPLGHFMSIRKQASAWALEDDLLKQYGGFTEVNGSYYVLDNPRKYRQYLPTAFPSTVIVGLGFDKHGNPLPQMSLSEVMQRVTDAGIAVAGVYPSRGAWLNDDGEKVEERGAVLLIRDHMLYANTGDALQSHHYDIAKRIRDLFYQQSVVLNLGYNGSMFV